MIDIPCPACGKQVGRVAFAARHGYWAVHLDGEGFGIVPSWDTCQLDPVDARLVGMMLNDPDWT